MELEIELSLRVPLHSRSFRKVNCILRREITVDEVGATGLYLASDLSAAVTGETLHVDAGYHAMGM